jgi:hypothetical protein
MFEELTKQVEYPKLLQKPDKLKKEICVFGTLHVGIHYQN